MDSSSGKRSPNPAEKSRFFAGLAFFFTIPTFRLANRRNFNEKDVYATLEDFKSQKLCRKIETEWNSERNKKSPCFLRTILKVFGLEYAIYSVAYITIDVVLMLITPNLMGKIVAYFNKNSKEIDVTFCIVAFIGSLFFHAFFAHFAQFGIRQVLLKVQIASSSLIYGKALRVKSDQAISARIVTLITKDLSIFDRGMSILPQQITGVAKIAVMAYTIYQQIGSAMFVGLGVMLLLVFVQGILGGKAVRCRLKTVKKSDRRIGLIQEALCAIRTIKMCTWETYFCKSVSSTRRSEVRSIQGLLAIRLLSGTIGTISSRISLFACVVAYAMLGNDVTAERAFTVAGSFAALGIVLNVYIPRGFITLAEMRAMVVRLNKYLSMEETRRLHGQANCLKRLEKGLTVISGPTGSGKSAILKAIAEEGVAIGRVSYASQEPWLFPGTIRQNVVFNEPFSEGRYRRVLDVCALHEDLAFFDLKDETLVGTRGLNLSQGQKVRINLARCVYRSADFYLLDDCLSAIDNRVAGHIFTECLQKFLEDKTVLLATSQRHPTCDVTQSAENHVEFLKIPASNSSDLEEKTCNSDGELEESAALLVGNTKRNFYREVGETGSVDKDVYFDYLKAGGVKIFFGLMVVVLIKQAVDSYSTYCMRFWVDAEQQLTETKRFHPNATEEALTFRNAKLKLYSSVIIAGVALMLAKILAICLFTNRASIQIHQQVMEKIVHSTMAFFDTTLAGNVINRFSRDFYIVDEILPTCLLDSVEMTLSIVAVLIVVSTTNSWFLIPSAAFFLIIWVAGFVYLTPGRNIRRVEGSVRSPVIGHVQATVDGLTTIRVSRAQETLKKEFDKFLDVHNSITFMHLTLLQAFRFGLEVITACYIGVIVVALPFLKKTIGAGAVGLAITQSYALSHQINWCAYQWSELELSMTSTERILEHANKAEIEPKTGITPTNWPGPGKIVYKNVNLRYYQNHKLALDDVNFTINPGEKIGIVGRTGAGKTSLISALFRLYSYEGTITIDDIDLRTINIDASRSRLSIVPQNHGPLRSGTVRSNLDPRQRHPDKAIWNALEQVEMKDQIADLSEFAGNFNVGEAQLICLARAILEGNSIVVLDEPTAIVDAKTENLVGRIVARAFARCTVMVVAHRLATVMECDKILVMDCNRVVEFDSPDVLLKRGAGVFCNMVREAGLNKLV